MRIRSSFTFMMLATAGLWAGCSEPEPGTTGDEQDITGTSDCDVVDMQSGKKLSAEQLAKLDDPIARFVLEGKGCPSSFSEINAKLAKTDTEGCAPGQGIVLPADAEQPCPQGDGEYCGGNGIRGQAGTLYFCSSGRVFPMMACKNKCLAAPPGEEDRCDDAGGVSGPVGNVTRFVSETSQVLETPDSYRAVVARRCGGREEHELLISSFGISADTKGLPPNVELIGKDRKTGAFNYYAREENQWRFFGTSKDFITAGYDCRNGACESKAQAKTRCATCHTGGGLVMKELNFPWVHWEGDTATPGTKELMSRFPELGAKGTGIDLEQTVIVGNREWASKRIAILKEKGVAEVLRPLFCTMDVNLQSAGSRDNPVTSIRQNLFVDELWNVFDGISFDHADYVAIAAKNGQRVENGGKATLRGKKGDVTDTFFGFTFPVRSAFGLDATYVRQLVTENVIDDDFMQDVAHVDFTRPIFSTARCDLLSAAPVLDAAKMTPAAIRDGFKANLKGKPGAGAQLLANLEKPNDREAHAKEVKAFLEACKARPVKEMLTDAMTYASQLRNRFRDLGVSEFRETLVVDDLPDGNASFDPVTCKLK